MANHDNGTDKAKAIMIQVVNLLDNIMNRSPDTAPLTFRIPVSFVLRSSVNADNPNSPINAIRIDRKAKRLIIEYAWSSFR